MAEKVYYKIEWDPPKAKINKKKHNVSFENAATIFKDPRAISIYDNEHSEAEDRWITIGLSSNGVLLVVHHTFNQIDKQLISI